MRNEKVVERLEKIIESCQRVKEDSQVHEDAVELARLVIKDCNRAIATILGKRFPGDDEI